MRCRIVSAQIPISILPGRQMANSIYGFMCVRILLTTVLSALWSVVVVVLFQHGHAYHLHINGNMNAVMKSWGSLTHGHHLIFSAWQNMAPCLKDLYTLTGFSKCSVLPWHANNQRCHPLIIFRMSEWDDIPQATIKLNNSIRTRVTLLHANFDYTRY